MKKPFDPKAPYQPDHFAFTSEFASAIPGIVARYPAGRQQSAVMPLLDLAQRQMASTGVGGWIPVAAMNEIARILDMPAIKVYEVATFYSMYNLAPVGKYLIQACTTTPCWLCNAGGVMKAVEGELGIHAGETTKDGLFTLMEVECLGACVNAPMVQINDDYYEDLTPDSMVAILRALRDGKDVPVGSQTGRKGSQALSGPTTLKNRSAA